MNKYIIFGSPRIEKEEINSVISTLKSSGLVQAQKQNYLKKNSHSLKK